VSFLSKDWFLYKTSVRDPSETYSNSIVLEFGIKDLPETYTNFIISKFIQLNILFLLASICNKLFSVSNESCCC